MKLDGKIAVVTGGGQGLGRGIALELSSQGADVVLAEIDERRGRETATEIQGRGGKAVAIATDVTAESSVENMVQEVLRTRGRIDILINNAGARPNVAAVVDLPLDEWNRVLAITLTGVLLCCRAVGRVMMRQESGKIVNISSINGINPAALSVAYNVAKAGVISLSRTLAMELAPYSVNVNAVCPGPLHTDFHSHLMPQRAQTLGISTEQMMERIRGAIPLGRWGEPEDVAKTVAFLVSDDTSWVTGETISVSGGLAGVSAAPPRPKTGGDR